MTNETEKPLIAIIYCRVSTASQTKKGDGLGSQETRCREICQARDWPVERVFYDRAVSGSLLDRPGIKELLQILKLSKHPENYVVVFDDISRFARDIRTHLDLRDAIINSGAQIYCPTVKFAEDSHSRYFEEMNALNAQHYRRLNAEQTLERMRARALKGYWPFSAPPGYKFKKKVPGHGNVLVRDEPIASILQEALQGFASGRFETQGEVKTFLESQPEFTSGKKNRTVRYEDVIRILTRPHYSGYIEFPEWDVSLRKAYHEPLISLEEYQQIQDRINGRAKAAARKDINEDFPLRGFVTCNDCSNPLTASWSTSKTGKKHPYYMCFTKGCESYRKSIRRDTSEGEFAALLHNLQPSQNLVSVTQAMIRKVWDARIAQVKAGFTRLKAETTKLQRQIDGLLDRIVDAASPTVITAYETRLAKLEKEKLLTQEKLANPPDFSKGCDELFELALIFLANPWKLWDSGRLTLRRTVLKLAFVEPISYCRKSGLRTPKTTLPFKVLEGISTGKCEMAERQGFEPWRRFPAYTRSRRAPSTTRPPLRRAVCYSQRGALY